VAAGGRFPARPGFVARPGLATRLGLAARPRKAGAMSQMWSLTSHEIRRRWRSLLIWGVAIGGLGALYVALFPSMSGLLNEYMKNAPDSMRQYMGEFQGPITIAQWMEMEFTGSIIPIALPFLVMLIGSRAIAGSEERKTLDLLLSNPLRRRDVVTGAAWTMALALAGVLVLSWVLTYIAVPLAGVDLSPGRLAAGLAVMWPYALFFGTLALLLSAIMRRGVLATTIAAVVLVAMYVIDGLGQVSKTVESFRFVSLIHQLGHPMQGDFPWTAVLVMLGCSVVFVALAMVAFARRDIFT
jgi:ABC-2 type transport system permease protein